MDILLQIIFAVLCSLFIFICIVSNYSFYSDIYYEKIPYLIYKIKESYFFTDRFSYEFSWLHSDIIRTKERLASLETNQIRQYLCPQIYMLDDFNRFTYKLSSLEKELERYNFYNTWTWYCIAILILLGIIFFIIFYKWTILTIKKLYMHITYPTSMKLHTFPFKFEGKLIETEHISLYNIVIKEKHTALKTWFCMYPIQQYTLSEAYKWQFSSKITLLNYNTILHKTLISHDQKDQIIIKHVLVKKCRMLHLGYVYNQILFYLYPREHLLSSNPNSKKRYKTFNTKQNLINNNK